MLNSANFVFAKIFSNHSLQVSTVWNFAFERVFFTINIVKMSLHYNRPFAAGGHMVQNPKYWRAKECDKTPMGNVNKEKSHFSS